MEIPPGRMDCPAIRKLLETTCLVHKTGNMLDGIVNFKFDRSHNIIWLLLRRERVKYTSF